jgi:hypothetical protein
MSGNSVKISIQGIEEVRRKLSTLGVKIEGLEEPLKKVGLMGKAAVASYPPYTDSWKSGKPSFLKKRPGAKYVRTGALQKSWFGRIQKKGKGGPSYIIYQKTSMNPKEKVDARTYMNYVQGSEQSSIHVGYWNTLEDWVDILGPIVTDEVERFINKIVK